MLQLTNFQSWHWRNRVADHPVAVADFTASAQIGETALAAIRNKFPIVRPGDRDLAGIAAAICLSMQRTRHDVPALCGVEGGQLWFAAVDPIYAGVTVGAAAAFLNGLIARPGLAAEDVARLADQLVERCEFGGLTQSTCVLVSEARRRGIPWARIGLGVPDIQLGQGHRQHRMRYTLPSVESALARTYATDKALSYVLLSAIGLPIGQVATATTSAQAVSAADAMGYPVVIKPIDGGHGKGVVVGLADAEAVRAAAANLLTTARAMVVQSMLPGDDHRLTVVSGRLVAALRLDPAAVVGDGVGSVRQLVEIANRDPRRGDGITQTLSKITIDDDMRRVLSLQSLALDSVPAVGRKVGLRLVSNVSAGGTFTDVMNSIHPDNAWLAERAAAAVGLTVAGVDLVTPDITRSWREVGGGICEVNSSVSLKANLDDHIPGLILETMFPPGDDGRIPTALVVGANASAAIHMLDHILRAAGHVVGAATAGGVTVDGRTVADGDFANLPGAELVLRDPMATAAVLEMARGDVLGRGIAVDRCAAAALLDSGDAYPTTPDRKIAETAQDAVVFNADDTTCAALSRDFPAERSILFSTDSAALVLAVHVAAGGAVVTLGEPDRIVIRTRDHETDVLAAAAAPATSDALAAVALAHGLRIAADVIATGLKAFSAA